MDRFYSLRCQVILATVGAPYEWSDLFAIALCPLQWLPQAFRDGQYLACQGRHATNLVEGMGEAIRRMHYE